MCIQYPIFYIMYYPNISVFICFVGTGPLLPSDNRGHPPGQDPCPEDTREQGILQEEDPRTLRQAWVPSDLCHHVCVVHLWGGNQRATGQDSQCCRQSR